MHSLGSNSFRPILEISVPRPTQPAAQSPHNQPIRYPHNRAWGSNASITKGRKKCRIILLDSALVRRSATKNSTYGISTRSSRPPVVIDVEPVNGVGMERVSIWIGGPSADAG